MEQQGHLAKRSEQESFEPKQADSQGRLTTTGLDPLATQPVQLRSLPLTTGNKAPH